MLTLPTPLHPDAPTFGTLLRQLRRQHGLTQSELGRRVGVSGAHISHLEKNQRLPDLSAVRSRFVEALALGDEPALVAQLVTFAATARGERPPPDVRDWQRRSRSLEEDMAVRASSLPVPPYALLGREQELSRACDRLTRHSGRLLTLMGPPGVGKSRLALAVAARLAPTLSDGVCYVPVAHLRDPASLAPAVLAAQEMEPGSAPEARLRETLRRRNLLLVLDNFDPLLAAAPQLARWLAACPGVSVLVTSRQALRLRSEQRMVLAPLDLTSAVELFVERARLVHPAFACTPSNRTTIEALCRRLDSLPLALEMAAAQMDLYDVTTLVERLRRRVLSLNSTAPDVPAHQSSLRQAFARSYDRLDTETQRCFRALGLFAGPFRLHAARAAGVEEPTLQKLLQVSLVMREPDTHGQLYYRLLETVREYARELLVARLVQRTVQVRTSRWTSRKPRSLPVTSGGWRRSRRCRQKALSRSCQTSAPCQSGI